MVSEVNRIYEQIGASFYIDSISYTNRGDWLDLRNDDKNEHCDLNRRKELIDIEKDTNGLELYFVNRVSKRALANQSNQGVVLTTNATAKTLVHELGHCFGCHDIYCVSKTDLKTPLSSDKVEESRIQMDWNNGTGVRYYSLDMTQSKLIRRLMMCGHAYDERADLSAGSVYGFTRKDEEGLVDVGFFRSGSRRQPIYHK